MGFAEFQKTPLLPDPFCLGHLCVESATWNRRAKGPVACRRAGPGGPALISKHLPKARGLPAQTSGTRGRELRTRPSRQLPIHCSGKHLPTLRHLDNAFFNLQIRIGHSSGVNQSRRAIRVCRHGLRSPQLVQDLRHRRPRFDLSILDPLHGARTGNRADDSAHAEESDDEKQDWPADHEEVVDRLELWKASLVRVGHYRNSGVGGLPGRL